MSVVQGVDHQVVAASVGSERTSFGRSQSDELSNRVVINVVSRKEFENHKRQFFVGKHFHTLRIGVDKISYLSPVKTVREAHSDSSGDVEAISPRIPRLYKRSREDIEADLFASGLGPSPAEIAENQKRAQESASFQRRRAVHHRVNTCASRALHRSVAYWIDPYHTPPRLPNVPKIPRRSLEDVTQELMALSSGAMSTEIDDMSLIS